MHSGEYVNIFNQKILIGAYANKIKKLAVKSKQKIINCVYRKKIKHKFKFARLER